MFFGRFVEYREFGYNIITLSFFVTTTISIVSSIAQIEQVKKIIRRQSGESVSYYYYSFFASSAIAGSIYGWFKDSLAMMLSGIVGIFMFVVVIMIFRYESKLSRTEKIMGTMSLLIIPIMYFVPLRDELFMICGLVVVTAMFAQIRLMRKNKSVGSFHPAQAVIGIIGATFWTLYGLKLILWPLLIFNPLMWFCWATLITLYYKYSRKEG